MSNFILSFLLLFLLWSGLVYPLSGQEIIFGAILSASISVLISFYSESKKAFKLTGIFHLLKFLFIFLWELVKANINMAKIVLNPSLPISPKILRVKTDLKSPVGQAFLTNAITLTPGTLSIDIDEDTLFIHVVEGDNVDDPQGISGPFEGVLKEAFDK